MTKINTLKKHLQVNHWHGCLRGLWLVTAAASFLLGEAGSCWGVSRLYWCLLFALFCGVFCPSYSFVVLLLSDVCKLVVRVTTNYLGQLMVWCAPCICVWVLSVWRTIKVIADHFLCYQRTIETCVTFSAALLIFCNIEEHLSLGSIIKTGLDFILHLSFICLIVEFFSPIFFFLILIM